MQWRDAVVVVDVCSHFQSGAIPTMMGGGLPAKYAFAQVTHTQDTDCGQFEAQHLRRSASGQI